MLTRYFKVVSNRPESQGRSSRSRSNIMSIFPFIINAPEYAYSKYWSLPVVMSEDSLSFGSKVSETCIKKSYRPIVDWFIINSLFTCLRNIIELWCFNRSIMYVVMYRIFTSSRTSRFISLFPYIIVLFVVGSLQRLQCTLPLGAS